MTSSHPKIRIALTGDVLVTQRIPPYEQMTAIKTLFNSHNCVIGNLETVVRDAEGYPEAFPGGGYCFCSPYCIGDLKGMGFNMFATANNHSMDYGHGGLLATIKYLNEYDIPHAGTGNNLGEAARVGHFDTGQGRIALVSVTSSFHDSYLAAHQNQDVCGRPGVSPLRHKALYTVPHEDYVRLKEIARQSGINTYHAQAIKEGYLSESKHFKFGTFEFEEGNDYRIKTTPLEADLKRSKDIIEDAKLESDIVIVSIHAHQFLGEKQCSPLFIETFSRECIRSGADIVFCHGPHLLRGVEKYGGGVIFYGLGNFILQHESMEYMPEEAYLKQGVCRNEVKGVQHLFKLRNDDGKKGLVASKGAWESVIVSVDISDTNIMVALYPINLMCGNTKGLKGLPYFSKDRNILDNIRQMSEKYQTEVIVDNENIIGRIDLSR